MTLAVDHSQSADPGRYLERFPPEVEFVISALEAANKPFMNRRKLPRFEYRVRASMKLFSDGPQTPLWELYTRHVSARAIDFILPRFLPPSHGGVITLPGPDRRLLEIPCTVLRCRQAAPEWFEGVVYFNREQAVFQAHTRPGEGSR